MTLNRKLILLILSILTSELILSIPVTEKSQQESKLPIISSERSESDNTEEKSKEKEIKSKLAPESKNLAQLPLIIFNPLGNIFFTDSDGILHERFVYRNPIDSSIWLSNGNKTDLEKLDKIAKEVISKTQSVPGLKPLRLKILGINAEQMGINVPASEQKYIILQNLDTFDIWTYNPLAIHENRKEYEKANAKLASNILRKLREVR